MRESRLSDGAVVNLQLIDAHPETIELRALVSARNAPQSWIRAARFANRCRKRSRIAAPCCRLRKSTGGQDRATTFRRASFGDGA